MKRCGTVFCGTSPNDVSHFIRIWINPLNERLKMDGLAPMEYNDKLKLDDIASKSKQEAIKRIEEELEIPFTGKPLRT